MAPLPSVRISVPADAAVSIPDEPYQPKYLFSQPRTKTLATIDENKEAAAKLTVEERLQQSSIMAMHLEGLHDSVDHSRTDGHKFFTFESGQALR